MNICILSLFASLHINKISGWSPKSSVLYGKMKTESFSLCTLNKKIPKFEFSANVTVFIVYLYPMVIGISVIICCVCLSEVL